MSDAIDTLAGVMPGSFLDTLRRRKPVTRDNAERSFEVLFAPGDDGEMSLAERGAVAYFVALLHRDQPGVTFYRRMVEDTALRAAVEAEASRADATGPYGSFPPGKLSAEDVAGPVFAVNDRAALGERLAAALEHVHMLIFHTRDAAPEHLRALERAGWSATGIVTFSQLVAFLSFQLRAAAGLRALDASRA
jgi:CMD domain protein